MSKFDVFQPIQVSRILSATTSSECRLPLYLTPVSAGFPSPCNSDLEGTLDLNELLIQHPAATFFVRAIGDSMQGAGIHSGDLLIVDRSIRPVHGHIVIAAINGELLVKHLHINNGKPQLLADNEAYPALDIDEAMDFQTWGVVAAVIHQFKV
jgi:DNA polymerase V